MVYVFMFRPDMPPGFMNNDEYPELPAAISFLRQYDCEDVYSRKKFFKSKTHFESELNKFPDYLRQMGFPKGQDSELRSGLFMEADGPDIFRIFAKSNAPPNKCWFGSLGAPLSLEKYFQALREARQREIEEYDD